jgi:sugar/nucleoside kinase (ribokinase family)
VAGDAATVTAAPDLVVVGSISSDRITIASGQTREVAGGAGLYAVLGAAAAGIRPGLAGIVSDDIPDGIVARLAAGWTCPDCGESRAGGCVSRSCMT